MIDTAQKRFSIINFGDGDQMLFEVDGTVNLDDKQHLLGCYSGIAFNATGIGVSLAYSIGNVTGPSISGSVLGPAIAGNMISA